MGSPCEPLSEWQEKVARLEELGFDATAPRPDWRDTLTDAEMDAVLARLDPAAMSEPPDVGEMLEAMRDLVDAADAEVAARARHMLAVHRIRTLLAQADKAMEAFRAD